jgi:putative endonuclease
VTLAWSQAFSTKHDAMHWEWQIKKWTRAKKETLCRRQARVPSGGIALHEEMV